MNDRVQRDGGTLLRRCDQKRPLVNEGRIEKVLVQRIKQRIDEIENTDGIVDLNQTRDRQQHLAAYLTVASTYCFLIVCP